MDNKKKLLNLISDLKLPLTSEEAREHVDKLSEDEISLLLVKAEVIKNHLSQIDKEANKIDSKAHRELKKKLDKELFEIEENYLNDMEKIQKTHDEKMNETEEQAKRKLKKTVSEHKSDVENISLLHDDVYKKVNGLISVGKAS